MGKMALLPPAKKPTWLFLGVAKVLFSLYVAVNTDVPTFALLMVK